MAVGESIHKSYGIKPELRQACAKIPIFDPNYIDLPQSRAVAAAETNIAV
mgnify:FL=1